MFTVIEDILMSQQKNFKLNEANLSSPNLYNFANI